MTEHHGTIGRRPDSGIVGPAMRNGIAHCCKQIRRNCARTAGVSDYAAHLVGSALKKATAVIRANSQHKLPTGVGGIPSFFHISQYILCHELPKTNEAAPA